MEGKTYIYSLNCPITEEVRYIGKSNNPTKRLNSHTSDKSKNYKASWIKSLKEQNLKPVLEIIDEVSNLEWEFWEQHYISLYKSWNFKLTNLTNGGDGVNQNTVPWNKGLKFPGTSWNIGISPSKEIRDKISKTLKGNKPWNTGTKGVKPPNSGSFKKGNPGYRKPNVTFEEAKPFIKMLLDKSTTKLSVRKTLRISDRTINKYITNYKNECNT